MRRVFQGESVVQGNGLGTFTERNLKMEYNGLTTNRRIA